MVAPPGKGQEKLTLARVYAAVSPSSRASPVLNRKINDLILPACHDLSLREISGSMQGCWYELPGPRSGTSGSASRDLGPCPPALAGQ